MGWFTEVKIPKKFLPKGVALEDWQTKDVVEKKSSILEITLDGQLIHHEQVDKYGIDAYKKPKRLAFTGTFVTYTGPIGIDVNEDDYYLVQLSVYVVNGVLVQIKRIEDY